MERRDKVVHNRDDRGGRPREGHERSRSPVSRDNRDDRRRDRSPASTASRSMAPARSNHHHEQRRTPKDSERQSPSRTLNNKNQRKTRNPQNLSRPQRQQQDTNDRSVTPSQPDGDSSVTEAETLAGNFDDERMQLIMGFRTFRSTKNTKVPGNDKNYGINKVKKTEYRQYMNRVGGFNRPLSPSRK